MEFINRHFDTNGFIEVKLDTLTIDYLWKITKRGLKNKISHKKNSYVYRLIITLLNILLFQSSLNLIDARSKLFMFFLFNT